MKRVISIICIFAALITLAACGSDKNADGATASIIANYSVKSADGEFIVEVQKNMGGVYDELYDENGIYIKFKGGKDKIYDKDGNEISRKDLNYGDALEIQYDGTFSNGKHKTIKAYKIIKII